jgi:ribosome-associated protein
MSEFENESLDRDDEKSKTQVKKELLALRMLGKQLVELSKRELDKLDLPEALRESIIDAQTMSKGALKRQIGFIGGLIAEMDHAALEQQLDLLRQPHQGQVREFHQLEDWRDRLLVGEDTVYGELIAEFDDFDVQHVRQLVRNADREAKQNKPPRSARLLFRYLQDLQQAQ